MREYILYVILVFLPIGAIMAYLLQKEGVSRKNIAMVVMISWLIIVSFPVSIAEFGTFTALLTYILAILVMTRYLLGNKKEYGIESKGTLVTGLELEKLLGNLENQGYDISTEQTGNYVSLGNESVLNSLIEKQAEELGVAELTELLREKSNVPEEMDIKDKPFENIIQETAENDSKKPDVFNESQAETDEILSVSTENNGEEKECEPVGEEIPAEDASGILSTDSELLPEEAREEIELTDIEPGALEILNEDIDASIAIEIEEPENEILEGLNPEESGMPKVELLEEPETMLPGESEELPQDEVIEAAVEAIVIEAREESENEAEETAENAIEEMAEELISETQDEESTAKAEPVVESLQAEAEDLAAASLDILEPSIEDRIKYNDSEGRLEEEASEFIQEIEESEPIEPIEPIEPGIIEHSGIKPAEPVEAESEEPGMADESRLEEEEQPELLAIEDMEAIDEAVESEEEKVATIEKIMAEAYETMPIERPEEENTAETVAELLQSEAENLTADKLDGVEVETEDRVEIDNEICFEEEVSELIQEIEESEPIEPSAIEDFGIKTEELVEAKPEEPGMADESRLEEEEQPELLAIEDMEAIDEAVESEEEKVATIEKIMAEAYETMPIERPEEESMVETETAVESWQAETEELAPAAKQVFKLIDQGFIFKDMSNWQEAILCFMEAVELTEDIELKELLNMELINIYQLLSENA